MLKQVVTMKEAGAMDIWIEKSFVGNACWFNDCCAGSIYHPIKESIGAARKERLRLSANNVPLHKTQLTTCGNCCCCSIPCPCPAVVASTLLGQDCVFGIGTASTALPKDNELEGIGTETDAINGRVEGECGG